MNRPLPTIALRPPTGLDRGARRLLVATLGKLGHRAVVTGFFRGTWADLPDYLDGLEAAGRSAEAEAIRHEANLYALSTQEWAAAVLTFMPDGDFLTALEGALGYALQYGYAKEHTSEEMNAVCERRGVPYRLTERRTFEWVGDPIVETEVLAPALSALDDPRLAGGPHDEFMAARAAMREGTAQAHRHAVAEACNAVESSLTVLLVQHGQQVPSKPVLGTLLKACRDAGLLPRGADGKSAPIEHVLASAGRFGNERGRHGAGQEPHDVEPDEAEAVVASAAVALTLIARRLPTD